MCRPSPPQPHHPRRLFRSAHTAVYHSISTMGLSSLLELSPRIRQSLSPTRHRKSSRPTTPSSQPLAHPATASPPSTPLSSPAPARTPHRRRRLVDVSPSSPPPAPPQLSAPSLCVSAPALASVLAAVPARFRSHALRLAYSTQRDGASLRSFYAACARFGKVDPVLVLVRDARGHVFGAYCSGGNWEGKAKKEYFGGGESFVFSFGAVGQQDMTNDALTPQASIYPWSRKNKYFQLGISDSLAIGGGRAFALFLDDQFEHGSSGPCDTFDSPCLASDSTFECLVFEAWAFTSRL
jgi:TLD